LSTLWTAILTFPLMAAVQEMCARIGMVTGAGLTKTIKQHYPKWLLYLVLLLSIPAIVCNIGADIAGMGAVGNLLLPSIHPMLFSVGFTVILLLAMLYLSYRKLAAILKYLCLVLLVYLAVPFFATQNWQQVFRDAILPRIQWNEAYLAILVGILGTTISPYLFFWQANMEIEELHKRKKTVVVDKRLIDSMNRDVNAGMFFSNLVMFFIILTAGTVLYNKGIRSINTVEEASRALQPLAGNAAYWLFSIGIIGTGLLAIPVLSGALSYMICETLEWEIGMDKKFSEARAFYAIIGISLLIGLSMNYLGVPPIQGLIYAAILYGLTAPVLIAVILLIANNKNIMGAYTNGTRSNVLGIISFLLMSVAGLALLYFFWKKN
ncbi:MAG TPA: divalent metal cation transporter, partial [Ferruginibacter sp.]|nr:divalent metal cation transporter [Ferruginibacter sp.]